MIKTLFNFLFNIWFNDVQNSNIFINHFESQKTCNIYILIHIRRNSNFIEKKKTYLYNLLCSIFEINEIKIDYRNT